MNLGKVLAILLSIKGAWVFANAETVFHSIEGTLIIIFAAVIIGTEKIVEAIKDKPSNITIGTITEVSEIKEVN